MIDSGSKQWSYIISLESACVLFLVLPCVYLNSELDVSTPSQILLGYAKTRLQVQVKAAFKHVFFRKGVHVVPKMLAVHLEIYTW